MSDAILPFAIDIPDADLSDLRARLARTRFPDAEPVDDWSQGIPLHYVRELCAYWRDDYDWRASEAQLNDLPQFKTEIDGVGVHFVHVRSPREDATPLLMTHGWPGSIVEFLKVIGPLSDPAAHGTPDSAAFHIVLPTIPGYGYSDKPASTGWSVDRVAAAWATLMARLGYEGYFAQGGDWGAAITASLGAQDPEHCIGVHTNMAVVAPTAEMLGRTHRGGTGRHRRTQVLSGLGFRLLEAAKHATPDARLQPGGLARWAGCLDRGEALPMDGLRRPSGKRPHPRRDPGQRDAVLANRRRGIVGPALLGEFRARRHGRRQRAGGIQRLPEGDPQGIQTLAGNPLQRPPLLQHARQRRALRRIRATRVLRQRASGLLRDDALKMR